MRAAQTRAWHGGGCHSTYASGLTCPRIRMIPFSRLFFCRRAAGWQAGLHVVPRRLDDDCVADCPPWLGRWTTLAPAARSRQDAARENWLARSLGSLPTAFHSRASGPSPITISALGVFSGSPSKCSMVSRPCNTGGGVVVMIEAARDGSTNPLHLKPKHTTVKHDEHSSAVAMVQHWLPEHTPCVHECYTQTPSVRYRVRSTSARAHTQHTAPLHH